MSRLLWNGRPRVAIALGAVLVVVALPTAPAWGASTVTTDCAGLQTAITDANPGDTIELTGLCNGSFTTPPPTASDVTIEGAVAGDGSTARA